MTCAPDVDMGVWVRPAKWVEWGAAAGTRWPAGFPASPKHLLEPTLWGATCPPVKGAEEGGA